MFLQSGQEIILASASLSRKRMLDDAGLSFRVVTADVDEGAIIEGLGGEDLKPGDYTRVTITDCTSATLIGS